MVEDGNREFRPPRPRAAMKKLSFIGCGKLGRTLGRLWFTSKTFEIHQVLTTSLPRAAEACEFIGAGTPIASIAELSAADVFLIATPDEEITASCERLSNSGVLGPGVVVLHCSGSHSSMELDAAKSRGAHVASAHPVKSFAGPSASVESFSGTCCAIEGDDEVLQQLAQAFAAIGGQPISLSTDGKAMYHAATVFASNYLVALMHAAQSLCRSAGVADEQMQVLLPPLVQGTLDNIFALGTTAALTGPISRGDCDSVSRHLTALEQLPDVFTEIYLALGKISIDLAKGQATHSPETRAELETLLSERK